ncbi:sugar ABC transporter, periplasmic sugar-binding protein, partial [mine drainage metagenome]
MIADTAIIESNGAPINAGVIDFNNPGELAVVSGIKSVFTSCPNCKILTTQDIEPQNWATKITGATSSMILANPNLNYIFPTADTMALFAVPGVTQSGATGKVSVVSEDGDSAVLSLIQKGTVLTADPG